MNIKLDLKKTNKWLSIIIIFVISISIVSISGLFLGIRNNLNNSSFQDGNSINIPRSAGYNTKLFITGINQTHTVRGSNFTLNGYTQKYEGGWINKSGIPVYPIMDGHLCDGSDLNLTLYPNLTVFSETKNSYAGQFSISINVPTDYDYTNDLGVLANITEIQSQLIYVDEHTVQNSTLNHDITTTTQLKVDTDTAANPVLPGDQFTLSMTLQDSTGTDLTSATNNFNVLTNGVANASYSISSSGGVGSVTITESIGLTSVGIEFLGMISKTVGSDTYYEFEGSNDSTSITRVESIGGSLNITNVDDSTMNYVFTNGSFLISGNIWANDNSSLKLSQRTIQILLNNQVILTTTTGANGLVNENFNLGNLSFYESNLTITITVKLVGYDTSLYSNPDLFKISASIIVDDAPPSTETKLKRWGLILLPILGVAGLVAGIVIFQRKRMDAASKLDYRLRAVDKSAKFAIITMLYSQGRKREAIAYTYKIYTDLIHEKYSFKRSSAQTLREFAIVCVMKYGLDPLRVYPYISMIEDVIYGAYEVDRKTFDKAITLFGRIFQEITGVLLTYNLAISEHSNLEQVTLKVSLPEEEKTKKIDDNKK
ncbi:MAG: hypothetical protein ACTSWX_01865 [Promethearchaeota archaeon]